MKKIISLAAALLILVTFAACDSTASSSSAASSATSSAVPESAAAGYDIDVYGNLPSNINNSGMVAFRDGTIYFRNDTDSNRIYSCVLSEKKINLVSKDAAGTSLNTSADGIYYIDSEDGSIKFVTYGGAVSPVYSGADRFLKILFYSGKLYALTSNELISLNTDGSEPTVLYSGVATYLNIWDGVIYFINGDNTACRLEDGKAVVISDGISTSDIVVNNGWIYYSNKNDYSAIYKIRTDGTDNACVNIYGSADLCVTADGILYYTNMENTYHPTQIGVNGENRDYVTQDKAVGMNWVGEYLIYTDMASQDMRIVKIGKKVPYDFYYFEW